MGRKNRHRISFVPLIIRTDQDGDLRTYISHAQLSNGQVIIHHGDNLDDEPDLTAAGRYVVEQLLQLPGIKVIMAYGRELHVHVFELVDWYQDGCDLFILDCYTTLLLLRPKRQRLAVERLRQVRDHKGKTVWVDDDEGAA